MQIRELRKQAGITQKELAATAKITPAYLCYLEKGTRCNPSLNLLERLAAALNVKVSDLLEQRAG